METFNYYAQEGIPLEHRKTPRSNRNIRPYSKTPLSSSRRESSRKKFVSRKSKKIVEGEVVEEIEETTVEVDTVSYSDSDDEEGFREYATVRRTLWILSLSLPLSVVVLWRLADVISVFITIWTFLKGVLP